MIRPIALVTTGTLASRLTGFVRDAMIAALLGAGAVADAFLIAFQLVTLIRRLLTEGALNAAFVPMWLRVRDQSGDEVASEFAGHALGTIGLGVALIALGLGLGIAAPVVIAALAPGFSGEETLTLAVANARLMLPYLAFAGPVAVMIALANAQRRVALSSAAPVLFNVALIAAMAVLLLNATDAARAAWIVAATVGLAGLLQLAMLAGASSGASPIRISVSDDMRALLRRALPSMIASAGPQMLIVGGAIVASRVPSAVSWLYFASRLIDLPLGIVSTISGAVLVTEASHAAHDGKATRTAQAHAVGVALALALPAAVGLFVLAEPIVRAVFSRGAFTIDDAQQTARALQMLAFGLPAQALVKALSPSYYARGDTMTPMFATLAGLAVALIAAFFAQDVAGIAAAIALGSAINAGLILARSGTFSTSDARLVPVVLAAFVLGIALMLAQHLIALQSVSVFTLALLIALGLAIDIAALFAFGALKPREIRAMWTRRGLRDGETRGTGTPVQRDKSK